MHYPMLKRDTEHSLVQKLYPVFKHYTPNVKWKLYTVFKYYTPSVKWKLYPVFKHYTPTVELQHFIFHVLAQ